MTLQLETPLVEFKPFGYLINKAFSSQFKLSKISFLGIGIMKYQTVTVRTNDSPLDWKQQIRWIDFRRLDLLSFVVFSGFVMFLSFHLVRHAIRPLSSPSATFLSKVRNCLLLFYEWIPLSIAARLRQYERKANAPR